MNELFALAQSKSCLQPTQRIRTGSHATIAIQTFCYVNIMGLFRRSRAIEIPAPDPVVAEGKKIKVVILTFPPNLEALTPEARNPKLVFQHETDSVVSSVSNCSCRMAHGRRRPECCQLCQEMKQALSPRHDGSSSLPPVIVTTRHENHERTEQILSQSPSIQAQLADSESSRIYSPRCGHKIPPALKFFSKIVGSTRTLGSSSPNTSVERSSIEEWQQVMLASPSFSAPRRHRKSRSAGKILFGKQHDSTLNQNQSLATDELSLDHELS